MYCAPQGSADMGAAAEQACASALNSLLSTVRVKGVPYNQDAPAGTRPLTPQVELPVGHDPCEACAEMGGGMPCEVAH